MALRDAAHKIAPIHIHSVEWSDRSVPVQKRTFSCPYVHYKRDTIRKSARWSVWFLHSLLTRFSSAVACVAFFILELMGI